MHYNITIGGRPVAYIKRMGRFAPYLRFDGEPRAYPERIAKGWLTTCRKFFEDVEMVPATTRHIGEAPEAS